MAAGRTARAFSAVRVPEAGRRSAIKQAVTGGRSQSFVQSPARRVPSSVASTLPRRKGRAYSHAGRVPHGDASTATGHGLRIDAGFSLGLGHGVLSTGHHQAHDGHHGLGLLRAYHDELSHHGGHLLHHALARHDDHHGPYYGPYYAPYPYHYPGHYAYYSPFDYAYDRPYLDGTYISSVVIHDREAYPPRYRDEDVSYRDAPVGGSAQAAGSYPATGLATGGIVVPDASQQATSETMGPPAPSLLDDGVSAFRAGRYEEARLAFVRAVLENEADGYAKFFYGLANVALGDYRAAALALRRALVLSPELIGNPIDVRSLYGNATDLSVDLASLSRFADDHPNDPQAQFVLGYMYYTAVQPARALAVFERLASSYPTDDLAGLLRDAAGRVVGVRERP